MSHFLLQYIFLIFFFPLNNVKARRAFWALKGIIRLQALVRGHLVRRQAVATLQCMHAIVKFQALVRGRIVRLSDVGREVHDKFGEPTVSTI